METSQIGGLVTILSAGHSGSTLLDLCLGELPGVFSTGELKQLTWQLFREGQRAETDIRDRCTCGARFRDCSVWKYVLSGTANEFGTTMEKLPLERPIKHIQPIDYFSASLSFRLARRLYLLGLSRRLVPNSLTAKYFRRVNQINEVIVNRVLTTTGSKWVVDSSKDSVRYAELFRNSHLRVFPVVLIRDIHAVLQSKHLQKRNISVFRRAWLRYYNHELLPIVQKLAPIDYVIISYERFIDAPRRELARLAKPLGLNSSFFNGVCHPRTRHLVAGNPIRYEDPLPVRVKPLDRVAYRKSMEKSGLDPFFLNALFKVES
jgi:hypothetical protein